MAANGHAAGAASAGAPAAPAAASIPNGADDDVRLAAASKLSNELRATARSFDMATRRV